VRTYSSRTEEPKITYWERGNKAEKNHSRGRLAFLPGIESVVRGKGEGVWRRGNAEESRPAPRERSGFRKELMGGANDLI